MIFFKFITYKEFYNNKYYKLISLMFKTKQIPNKLIKLIEYYGYCKPVYTEGRYTWICSKSLYLLPYLTFEDMDNTVMYYLDLLNKNYNAEHAFLKGKIL